MSKIFDAYKKRAGGAVDLTREIGRAGTITLYSVPTDRQQVDFDQLANRILGLRHDARGTVLSFASTASGEGSSFVSYNTAMVLAHTYHQKVVWIDSNFLTPQTKLMGLDRLTFGALLQNPVQADNLVAEENPLLIGGGTDLIRFKGLLADAAYGELLDNLAQQFDFVILDLPPVIETRDTALMAAGGDGLLLVIEQKYLKREIVEHGLQILQDKDVRVFGTVINRREYLLPKIIYDRL